MSTAVPTTTTLLRRATLWRKSRLETTTTRLYAYRTARGIMYHAHDSSLYPPKRWVGSLSSLSWLWSVVDPTYVTSHNHDNDQQPKQDETAAWAVSCVSIHHPSFLPLSSSWWLQLWHAKAPKKGTGFDRFFPNQQQQQQEEEETKKHHKETTSASSSDSKTNENHSDKEEEKKDRDSTNRNQEKPVDNDSEPFSKKGEKASSSSFHHASSSSGSSTGDSGGGGGGFNSDDFSQFATALLVVFLLTDAFYRSKNKEEKEDSQQQQQQSQQPQQDISWHDLHHLIETRQIEKLVVYNPSSEDCMVRVILKPGMVGLAGVVDRSMMSPTTRRFGRDGVRRTNSTRGSNRRDHHEETDKGDAQHFDEDQHHGRDSAEVMDGLSSLSSRPNRPALIYRLNIGSVETFEHNLDEIQRSLNRHMRDYVPVQYKPDSTVASELLGLVPNLVMVGIFAAIVMGMRGQSGASGGGGGGGMGGIFQIGKSTAKKIAKEDISVTFKDVAGCQEAKKEIMEFVDFLQDSSRFTALGAKIPKGALLCGPPGTGKTLLAKAVAGEANVPFYSISGSDFIEMFVGVGPSRVRDLFKEARQNAPCIVFIDEIDAVGRQRGRGGVGGNDERENTLNQLLVEMDGFSSSTNVVVLAGTNRADILDQALTRPGRFDRQIQVDKPDLQGRKEIFLVHLRGIELEEEAEQIAGRLAGLTPGFAGADIANICNEAAIVAARRKGESVSMDDFEKATDRIVGGLESNKIMSKDERSIVAHHEAGHAVAGWFLEHADPLLKVTIIPRSSGALGYAQYLPKEVFLRTEEQIMDIVCMALAGRAAEEIFFGRVTTGASDDLRRVTDIVYSTIQLYGMNERLGQLAFPKDPNAMFDDRPYSDATAKAMDEEARRIVDAAYKRTLDLLTEKKKAVEQVAAMLLDKETITHDDVVEVLGDRPFQRDTAYDEFVKRRKSILKDNKGDEGGDDSEKKESASTDDEAAPLNPGMA